MILNSVYSLPLRCKELVLYMDQSYFDMDVQKLIGNLGESLECFDLTRTLESKCRSDLAILS